MSTVKEQKANLNLIARMDSDAKKMRTHPQAEESVLNARKAIRSASKGKGSAALVGASGRGGAKGKGGKGRR